MATDRIAGWITDLIANPVAGRTAFVRSRRARGPRPAGRTEAVHPTEHGGPVVLCTLRSAVAAVPRGSVTVRVPHRLPPVAVGPGPLERVVAAMVATAARRTPPGARMLVRADAVAGEPGIPGVVEIRVADRGPDLAGEAKSWLLAGPDGSADGLSAAVRQLTAAGGGRLTVEDNPAGGLVLVLRLPTAAHG
ncbi:hypothetical protein [Kitasatospora sp. NPDC097643]|uniref:hypothetical protein n=1 Tax=Kitasatospora sp. NPDC097643 TaxID=3157230 RepID=UPI0033226129